MPNLSFLKRVGYRSSHMYAIRMAIAFFGTTFIPYWLGEPLYTIPLTLGVVAAALSDIDDRFSVHLRNLIFTYIGFFTTAVSVELLFPHPILFGIGLIFSCFILILLGSLGPRYATISYGCLVISVYTMLGVDLFPNWYQQPTLLVSGAIWYGVLSSISALLFPVRVLKDQLVRCYAHVGNFLFVKANFFDVDMTAKSYQNSMIDLSLSNSKVVQTFNTMRISLVSHLKGDRGQKTTRRSLHYYFVIQDIHERANSAHIEYQKLATIFEHRDILFRFQRILTLQGKACQDLAHAINKRQHYQHNPRFLQIFQNLNRSLDQLEKEQHYDVMYLNALRGLQHNLKEINAQLNNFEVERAVLKHAPLAHEDRLKNDDLKGWQDIQQRIKQNFNPESVLFRHAMRLSILMVAAHCIVQLGQIEYGYWIVLTVLFVCQPNFNATKRRLKLRILGTLAGVALGVIAINYIPAVEGKLLLIILSGVLFLQLRAQQYAQATMFMTLLALLNFNLADPNLNAALPRVMYTVVGCMLAWLGIMFLWPDWKFRRLSQVIEKSVLAQSNYLAEIIKQYHQGRNHGLDYRVVRRHAHLRDAELASLISTLATEPDFDPNQKQAAFDFLCLHHTLLSYIAALGAHRNKIEHPNILKLLDQTLADIRAMLLHDQAITSETKATIVALGEWANHDKCDFNSNESTALQQVTLIFNILDELATLKQKLCHEHDSDATALASL